MKFRRPFAPILLLIAMTFLTGIRCSSNNTSDSGNAPTDYKVNVVRSFPHDTTAFTQGLVIVDGALYESTGLKESSTLRRLNLRTGALEKIYALGDEFFAEGLTYFDEKFIQLTWTSGKGFVYRETSDGFEQIKTEEFTIAGEGWGLTQDGENLWMSDGSANLYKLDPKSKKVLATISVTNNGKKVFKLNELEFVDDRIFANVWQDNIILIIDPNTGVVNGVIDVNFKDLFAAEDQGKGDNFTNVLNGIAYNDADKKMYITGKNWPKIFEITLEESAAKK